MRMKMEKIHLWLQVSTQKSKKNSHTRMQKVYYDKKTLGENGNKGTHL